MDRGKTLIGVIGGLVSGLVLLTGSFAVLRTLQAPRPSAAGKAGAAAADRAKVTVTSNVAGAQILIDGTPCGLAPCQIEIKPGAHQAEARKPAYAGDTREFIVRAKDNAAVEMSLQPLPSSVEVASDLVSGRLQLDRDAPLALSGGTAHFEIPPGSHKLRFTSGAFEANFEIEVQAGAPPKLIAPPATRGLRAIVVAGAGPLGRLWSTEKQAELLVGARELGLVPDDGIALPALDRGAHRFILKRPQPLAEIDFAYEIAENPTVWISLRTNRKLGTLQILTGLDGAKVILDGKDTGSLTRRGGRALLLAPPGSHEVRVEKAGFIAPPPQKVTVREGGEAALEFRLDPQPTRASLAVIAAPPGAVLSIDGRQVATAGPDGSANLGDLEPGARVLTARRPGYLPGKWDLNLTAGRNGPARAPLQRAPATLRVTVQPAKAAAQITVRRAGQFDEKPISESEPPLTLPDGDYTVTGVDTSGQRQAVQVKLEGGKESVAAIVFAAAVSGPKAEAGSPPVKSLGLDAWEAAGGGWKRTDGMVVQEGDGIHLAPVRASAHAVTFAAKVRPGRPVRWVTQFRDRTNYTLYDFDGQRLERIDFAGGKRTLRNRASHAGPADGTLRIRMSLQSGVLRTSAMVGGQWVDLDTAEAPNGTGRFGFYVAGRDRIALSDFRYEYR